MNKIEFEIHEQQLKLTKSFEKIDNIKFLYTIKQIELTDYITKYKYNNVGRHRKIK